MDLASLPRELSLFARGPMVLFQWRDEAGWPVEYVSENLEKVLGYDREAFLREPSFAGLIHPEDRPQVEAEVERFLQGEDEELEHRPFRLQVPSGQERWLRVHTTRSCPSEARDPQLLSYVLDVSHQIQAERALKESEHRYHQMFETNLAVKLIIDPTDGRIVEANQAAEKFYGYSLQDLSGLKITDINTLSPSEVTQEMERARTEERLFFNFKHRLKSGEVRDVEVYSGPVQTAQGQLLYSIIYDVTERHHAEASLQASHQHLAETLHELEQTQKQMVQRERLAAVGQLTAGIAHDFNNILAGILGFAELLRHSSSESKPEIESIIQSGERGAKLIQQLLDFSRKSLHQFKPLELVGFLREFTHFLSRTIPSYIDVGLEVEGPEHWISADPTQLQQVLTNLAVNARDAILGGGSLQFRLRRVELCEALTCSLCEKSILGPWIQLELTDTGRGIEEQTLPRIFEPFFTTKPVGKGSGLGLSQVAGIISQHDAHIRVQSTPGQGTRFSCYFPPCDERPPEQSPVEKPSLAQGRGETILLVEDDLTVRAVLQSMLKKLGYQPITAHNGKKALEIYEHHPTPIALVLSDVMMPILGGMELFRQLLERHPGIKMILMSGYPLSEEDAQELERCDVSWTQKPISLLRLSQLLHKALTS